MTFSFQVVDEIDGALGDGKGAVEVLLKMVSNRCYDWSIFQSELSKQTFLTIVILKVLLTL